MLITVRLWILLSALLVASGWILSALHQLNPPGYGAVFCVAAIAVIYWQKKTGWRPRNPAAQMTRKFLKRFKHPAPLLFFCLLVLSFIGGSLYAPNNGDTEAYRTPRVLHWLYAQHWHWIHTLDPRLNIAACGFEWLAAPLILLAHNDRLLFLINIISYSMLPGLIYSVFTRLGVSARAAWWWMWILPSGWCFALQAGSVVNDSFATIYALASVDLALRAKEKNSIGDFWLSMLAGALVTGAKQCDIPLILLWLIAAWPAFSLPKKRPLCTTAVVGFSLLVSVLPITVFNFQHSGNWMGFGANQSVGQLITPFWGIVGNTFCLSAENLMPPIFPWAAHWNALMDRFVTTPFGHHFASFEHFGQLSFRAHSIGEGNAGIGLGICTLMVVSIFTAWRYSKNHAAPIIANGSQQRLLRIVPWALLFVFMAKVGTYENARQLAPYYAFFLPFFLARPGNTFTVRHRWWQRLGLLIMIFTAALLVFSRSRPLFPAQTILDGLHASHPDSRSISRLEFAFTATLKAKQLSGLIAKDLPPDEKLIGYATLNGSAEQDLWFPFGRRAVQRVTYDDTPEKLKAGGIHYVVVDSDILDPFGKTIGQWMAEYQGVMVDKLNCLSQPDLPPYYIYLVRLQP
ncbi:MAG TPA: hypothetical protein VGI03_09340 [Verrucomicrobiae bacterium]|jgi:hypothetical protein